MMAACAWDDEEEHFHPVLRQMLPEFKKEDGESRREISGIKTAYELLMSMFEAEMAQEELEKDECYDCCYAKCGPCIGLCYKTLKG